MSTWDDYTESTEGRLAYALDEIYHLKQKLAAAHEGLAYAYQLAGAVGARAEVLDNFIALESGKPLPHPWPFPAAAQFGLSHYAKYSFEKHRERFPDCDLCQATSSTSSTPTPEERSDS